VHIYAEITLGLTIIYMLTLLFFLYGTFKTVKGTNEKLYSVSVIIAARNEEENIRYILDDLTKQNYPKHLYDISVADDHSSDRTVPVVREFCKHHKNINLLTITDTPAEYSPKKYVLECAVKSSKSEIILATDADCRVGPQWIRSMVSFFTPDVGFVAGFSQLGRKNETQNLLERLQALDFMQLMGATVATYHLGHPLAASGQNMGYRREAFQQVGGYKKVAHRVSGDDILLMQLIRKFTHYRLRFATNPDAYATSKAHSTMKGLLNQRKRWASNGSFQIFFNMPFFIYLVLVFLVNLNLFIGSLSAIALSTDYQILLLCFLIKAVAEFVIAIRTSRYFNRADLLRYFPLWFFLQIPYVVISGFLGTFGKFTWKDRSHSAQIGKQNG
jgi:cellulose synthase/poly-beta-1,6-N-acetylglucosamine synthase-like glycosyltransferase